MIRVIIPEQKRNFSFGLLVLSALCLGCWSTSSESRIGGAEHSTQDQEMVVVTREQPLETVTVTAGTSFKKTAEGIVPTVTSNMPFPVMDASFVLKIGEKIAQLNYIEPDSAGKTAVFHAISEEAFQSLPDGTSMSIVGDHGQNLGLVDFEPLDKSNVEAE